MSSVQNMKVFWNLDSWSSIIQKWSQIGLKPKKSGPYNSKPRFITTALLVQNFQNYLPQ